MTSVLENGIGASTAYWYDVQGNLLSVEQGSQLRSFGYTSLGRLSSAINPESGTTGYTYFDNGNLKTKTDARGITTTMAYDGLNRVTSNAYSDGTPSVSYTYDTNETIPNASAPNFIVGHLAQVSTTSSGTAYVNTYQYDAVGRATASMQSIGTSNYPFLYTYLPAGMQTETYPSGRLVTDQLDAAGRISQVADASVTYASNVAYAPQGAVSSFKMGNNITETTSFNTRLQPWQIQAGSLLTLTYGYGTASNNGNVLSAAMNRGSTWTQIYAYDGANRLTGASETGPGTSWYETYGYDGYGNQWLSGYSGMWTGAVTSETPQSSSWYNGANQISNGGSWTYDSAGNIKTVGGMSRSFSYDAESRQTQAVVNGTTENYVYDGEGRRVAKSTSSGTTTYIYDADGQLAMEFPSGTVPTGTSYLTVDTLGSTRLTTDGSGNAAECEDYLPFGGQIQSGTDGRSSGCFSAADVVPEKKFTSKERDVNSGLDYFGARYFSGAQGRWTSPDQPFADQHPEDPQSWDMYGYVRNNPLAHFDPDGKQCEMIAGHCEAANLPHHQPTARDVAVAGAMTVGVLGAAAVAPEAGVWTILQRIGSAAVGWALSHPQEVQEAAASVAENVSNGPPGSLATLGAASRLATNEIETGERLAQKFSLQLTESSHVGAEFVDSAGKSYDALGSVQAYEHFNETKFLSSIDKHLLKSNDYTVVDLTGANEAQEQAIRNHVSGLGGKLQDKVLYVGGN
jgi:RHS repeat-associated protein